MITIALDTSAAVGAAVVRDGEVVSQRSEYNPRAHVELLTPFVRQVLADAGVSAREVDHVVCGVGPGPFTGLRVAITSARVHAYAANAGLHGICSLDALAAEAFSRYKTDRDVVVMTDARRREVYSARYRHTAEGLTRIVGPSVGSAADVDVNEAMVVGRGAELYADHLPNIDRHVLYDPRPDFLGVLAAQALAGDDTAAQLLLPAEPLYLRSPDVVEPTGERKSVLAQ